MQGSGHFKVRSFIYDMLLVLGCCAAFALMGGMAAMWLFGQSRYFWSYEGTPPENFQLYQSYTNEQKAQTYMFTKEWFVMHTPFFAGFVLAGAIFVACAAPRSFLVFVLFAVTAVVFFIVMFCDFLWLSAVWFDCDNFWYCRYNSTTPGVASKPFLCIYLTVIALLGMCMLMGIWSAVYQFAVKEVAATELNFITFFSALMGSRGVGSAIATQTLQQTNFALQARKLY